MIQRWWKNKMCCIHEPMSQEYVSMLTSFLNVFILLPTSVGIWVRNRVQCCGGMYRRRAWSLTLRSPQDRWKHTQETGVHRERGNEAQRKSESRVDHSPRTETSKGRLQGPGFMRLNLEGEKGRRVHRL